MQQPTSKCKARVLTLLHLLHARELERIGQQVRVCEQRLGVASNHGALVRNLALGQCLGRLGSREQASAFEQSAMTEPSRKRLQRAAGTEHRRLEPCKHGSAPPWPSIWTKRPLMKKVSWRRVEGAGRVDLLGRTSREEAALLAAICGEEHRADHRRTAAMANRSVHDANELHVDARRIGKEDRVATRTVAVTHLPLPL
jgi:hypothetical protein